MAENDKQTEEKIFDAATEVFLEKGLDGTRMQDIADRAGIHKSLLHYYYRTKDRLFNAVFEKIAGEMFKKFAPVFDDKVALEDKIRFFLREHIAFLQKNPRLPSFLLNEINRNPAIVRKFIQTLDVTRIWATLESQHKDELEKYNITSENIPQLMVSIVGMSVFPFAARGLLSVILERFGGSFNDYIEKRKEYAADFVIGAIRKE
ncbi:MAG TPA: TetR/AcrR family transcriptional regulator [Bacteroidales bacterium]|nr:TetR/AcrR family transcriptional regulator [Bacteroidales bacterium]HPT01749.1 TetR/AcrR family transcriptional regulator [Bacteroidales bacterium]